MPYALQLEFAAESELNSNPLGQPEIKETETSSCEVECKTISLSQVSR
jgi:hypothetical protein